MLMTTRTLSQKFGNYFPSSTWKQVTSSIISSLVGGAELSFLRRMMDDGSNLICFSFASYNVAGMINSSASVSTSKPIVLLNFQCGYEFSVLATTFATLCIPVNVALTHQSHP